uniref:Uncharacterized protein n=1 Tax=Zea mays TaxID=4577 RepID=A0A804P7Y5_MAIZE
MLLVQMILDFKVPNYISHACRQPGCYFSETLKPISEEHQTRVGELGVFGCRYGLRIAPGDDGGFAFIAEQWEPSVGDCLLEPLFEFKLLICVKLTAH